MSIEIKAKPKVLALMPFKAIEEDYLNDFRAQFILHVSTQRFLEPRKLLTYLIHRS
jgi:hypothetical protein